MKYFLLITMCACTVTGCSKFNNAKLEECEFKNKNIAESSLIYQTKLQLQITRNFNLENKIESMVESRVRMQKMNLAKERESMIIENNQNRAALRNVFGLSILGMLIGFGMINYWILKKYLTRKPKNEK